MTTREVFAAALALPSEERERLIDELAASLETPGDVEVSAELKAIVLEREKRVFGGERGVPAEEFFEQHLRR